MNISNTSNTGVWAVTTRTLTSIANTISIVTTNHGSLANGANVDLRASAGTFRDITVIGEAAVNVTWVPALYDGTTFRPGVAGASGAAITVILKGGATFGPALQNTGTVSGNYDVAGAQWN